ncbi:TolC family outer membrane protein [Qipengyuania sediminis]|uniref:TolC family outer membrane protein n=1 Tax=Qipengyuania sediminis TaxID=1532023 RepID=UPI00105A4A12|nr:TolC family outer membrane protein [Qipengyuania sediminis]
MRASTASLLVLGAALSAQGMPASADTLREALAAAYRNNPTLAAARANQRATDEGVAIQRSAGRPNVSANGQYLEFVKQASDSFINPDRAVNGQLNLGVPIYQGGAVRNGIRGAVARVEAGRADLRGAESDIFTQTVAAYMDVLRAEALVGLQANQVDVLAVNAEATSDRFEIGDLTRTDVAQSEARLALARGNLRTAQANLIAARETYAQLTGLAADDLEPPPPLPGFPASVDEAVAIALEQNPDLIGARGRARAAGFDTRVAGAGRLPRVSVITGGTYNNYLGSLDGIGAGGAAVSVPQSNNALQVGVQLNVPLFQGGLPAAQRRQAQAREGAALETVIAAERLVIAQVRSAWGNWQAASAVIASAQTAVDAAALSLEGVRAENSIGNRTILDTLNAEQELLQARTELVTARRNAYVAGFQLLAAMGRAEARDLGLVDEGLLYDPVVNYDRVSGKWFDFDDDPAPVVTTTSTATVPAATSEVRGGAAGALDGPGDESRAGPG